MTGITRRGALLGAGAAAVVAGAPGAVQGEGAMLQRRYAEWEAAYEAFDHALDELAVVERQHWSLAKERGIERETKAYEALGHELGVDAAHDNEDRTSDEERKAYECFLDTPTGSFQDMARKVKAAQKHEDSAAETALVQALSRDFERLFGEAQP